MMKIRGARRERFQSLQNWRARKDKSKKKSYRSLCLFEQWCRGGRSVCEVGTSSDRPEKHHCDARELPRPYPSNDGDDHIEIYLSLYRQATPDQGPYSLPLDLDLNLDDLYAVFDRPAIDARKRGRPKQEHSGRSVDRQLIYEMHRMLAAPAGERQATSATEAARILVGQGRVPGGGTDESKIKRLQRKFRFHYSS